jgi:hypothetical protein
VEHTNILDAEDAASQACSLLGLTSGVEGLR